jgi:hypothetical protein
MWAKSSSPGPRAKSSRLGNDDAVLAGAGGGTAGGVSGGGLKPYGREKGKG